MNTKGTSVMQFFAFIFFFLLAAMFIGLFLWGFNLVNDVLGIDVDVGQVNLKAVNDQTFGAINVAFVNNADTLGIVVLLSMCVFMILNGYMFGRDNEKLWIIVDIFILIFVFILAVYMSQVYEIFINSTELLRTVFVDDMPKTSKFMLNLPSIVGTVGALIMIATYTRIRREEEESINVFGV